MKGAVLRWIAFVVNVSIVIGLLYAIGVIAFLWPPGMGGLHNGNPGLNNNRHGDLHQQAIRAVIVSGAVLIRGYQADDEDLKKLHDMLAYARRRAGNTGDLERKIADVEKSMRATYGWYRNFLLQTAHDFTAEELSEELDNLSTGGFERFVTFACFAELFVSQVKEFRGRNVIDDKRVTGHILGLPPYGHGVAPCRQQGDVSGREH